MCAAYILILICRSMRSVYSTVCVWSYVPHIIWCGWYYLKFESL